MLLAASPAVVSSWSAGLPRLALWSRAQAGPPRAIAIGDAGSLFPLVPPPPPPLPPPEAPTPEAPAPSSAPLSFTPEVLKPSKIQRGDYVIHKRIGVGRFEGLMQESDVTFSWDDDGNEIKYRKKYLLVHFRDGDMKIYLRDRNDIKLFKRKSEEDMESVRVRLDGIRSRKSWEKRKAKAASSVFAVAADLLKMYAERQELTREPCQQDGPDYAAFERDFVYEPTADQLSCFEAIRADMVESERPMDRLICGDVGFGKTEVAMRAVYRAVANGRQVAFLAPTTVLAAQHLRVLRARMPDVRVELLSSLIKRSKAQLEQLRWDIGNGTVQVAVGTHALLSDKITYAKLGLLVVDEEQRFGVKQKEKIKGAATNVDVLSLSATPIPRTFYMCATGIRDMSLLSTPPSGRLKVNTRVVERSDSIMLDAVRKELARGGQVFYVVPRIEQVESEVNLLRGELPDANIDFAYSGIRELERRIVDFTMGETDVMVSTTIMENGIDIPNVNTLVVQNTHLFGLSQLHQLRGRVGRSNLQAHAVLMHPPHESLSEIAIKRMRALEKAQDLGAGYQIAESDLKLRGAGNLFGTEQKGVSAVGQIGLDMYLDILQKAMVYLQRQKQLGVTTLEEEAQLKKELGLDENTLLGLSETLR